MANLLDRYKAAQLLEARLNELRVTPYPPGRESAKAHKELLLESEHAGTTPWMRTLAKALFYVDPLISTETIRREHVRREARVKLAASSMEFVLENESRRSVAASEYIATERRLPYCEQRVRTWGDIYAVQGWKRGPVNNSLLNEDNLPGLGGYVREYVGVRTDSRVAVIGGSMLAGTIEGSGDFVMQNGGNIKVASIADPTEAVSVHDLSTARFEKFVGQLTDLFSQYFKPV